MNLEFANVVRLMRDYQRRYFEGGKNREDMYGSKQQERRVDEYLGEKKSSERDEFEQAVYECRAAQKAFFADGGSSNVAKAKAAERKVDKLLRGQRQKKLFD